MKRYMAAVCILLIAGCGSVELPRLDSLLSRQPRVLSVEPTDGATVAPESSVAVEFSQPIDPSSIDPTTLAIVRAAEDEDVVKAVVDGDAAGVEGVYEFQGAGLVAVFRPLSPFEAGASYKVIATGKIMSTELIPLSQGAGGARPFVSGFTVEGDGASTDAGAEGDAAGEATAGGGGAEAVARPSFLVINEILYDVPGDDTNGQLFVELLGDAGADIGGYKVVFITGDTGAVVETVEIPKGAKIPGDELFLIADSMTGKSGVSQVAGADFIDNFDPPNGPDCVQILDEKGGLVDALGYGTPIKSPAANNLECFEGTPAPKAAAGTSLSRTDGIDSDDNTADFHALTPPTPGAP